MVRLSAVFSDKDEKLFLWDVKEPTPLFKKSRGVDPSGVVNLHTTQHIIHIMGWVGTVSSKWTESSCQWCLCMLTSKLTIHMLGVSVVLSCMTPSFLHIVILVTELSHHPSHPSHPSHLSYLISLVILVFPIALVNQVSLLNLTIPVVLIIILSSQSSQSPLPSVYLSK